MVNASSSACVGCSCMPSPALMIVDLHMRASRWGVPDDEWRMTIMSGDIASMLRTVSRSDSPLVTLDVAVAMLSVSALRRFSAISNDVRVRVLGSKNRFTTVRPRSVGTFLIARPPISFMATAVSRMRVISSASSPAMPSRCRDFSATACAGVSMLVGVMRPPRSRLHRPRRFPGAGPARFASTMWVDSCRRSRP